ncbi:MAG: hypothetical protein J6T33_06165, partial [Bacteroidales bacterium]|nr:hypothetical protein [Bacteroidales bacterium]
MARISTDFVGTHCVRPNNGVTGGNLNMNFHELFINYATPSGFNMYSTISFSQGFTPLPVVYRPYGAGHYLSTKRPYRTAGKHCVRP